MSLKYKRLGSLGARPIPLPLEAIAEYVEMTLVPKVQDDLERLARTQPDEPVAGGISVYGGRLSVPKVYGGFGSVTVYVQSQPGADKSYPTKGGGYSRDQENIIIFLNGALSPAEFLRRGGPLRSMRDCAHLSCLPYALYTILMHELTHAADVLQPSVYDAKKVMAWDTESMGVYFNDPNEVRAHMREVVEETKRMAEVIKPHVKGRQDLVAKSLKFSQTWKTISPYLTPANKNRILLAVYDGMAKKGLV